MEKKGGGVLQLKNISVPYTDLTGPIPIGTSIKKVTKNNIYMCKPFFGFYYIRVHHLWKYMEI